MTASFQVKIESLDGDVTAAAVGGELDLANVPELERLLAPVMDESAESLLVDLSECEFIDSSGLAALVAARERLAASNGRRFAICCPHTQVRRLLEVTGLHGAMGVADSREDALATLRAPASSPS